MALPERVGLFGGTFDPVHNAHLALARTALAELALDELRWIPAGQPWQKVRTITSAEHRVAMLRLAIAGQAHQVLDCIELELPGDSVTWHTVQALAAAHPGTQWFLILGQDQYGQLHTWRHWRELLGCVVPAVAGRPGDERAADPEVLQRPHRELPMPLQDISSSEIRHRVQAGQDISQLVPPEVARYIELHGLYRAPEGASARS